MYRSISAIASFHQPGSSPASVTCDKEQDICIGQFKFSSHSTTDKLCTVICFVVVAGPSGEGLTSGCLSRHAVVYPRTQALGGRGKTAGYLLFSHVLNFPEILGNRKL